jgi:hypothetical protein
MAQPNPERVTFDQLLKLVGELTAEEQDALRRQLDNSWNDRWDKVVSTIRQNAQSMPELTDEEIIAEVKAVRKAKRDQGSN